jgi:hypothetical protein
MLLEQINRRLATFAVDHGKKKMTTTREPPAPYAKKIIGVSVDAETYQQLLVFMKSQGLKSLKDAALEAIKRGVK